MKSLAARLAAAALAFAGAPALAQAEPPCSADASPYRDFDFVLGEWAFFTPDGRQIGSQTYELREQGCLIVEEWTTAASTGTGMTFVDPQTGLWRQVWMSPAFHIDYSGGLDETGAMALEGVLFDNARGVSMPVRGLWAPEEDGSVRQEFHVQDAATGDWSVLFAGVTRRVGD